MYILLFFFKYLAKVEILSFLYDLFKRRYKLGRLIDEKDKDFKNLIDSYFKDYVNKSSFFIRNLKAE